jgi:HD-like signal output (HDOD) protein
MNIELLVGRQATLPTIPKVALQVIESFGSEHVAVAGIARQIAADPALSAKVLQLANSAYFQLARTIGTLEDAVRILGFSMVRNLVIGNSMVGAFRGVAGMDLAQFWRYNLYTACTARWLARRTGTDADVVFTLALLHAIGQLQMHVVAPAAMLALDKRVHVLDRTRAQVERETLGFHFGDVSAELARHWNLPPLLADALRDIPAPPDSGALPAHVACVCLGAWRAGTAVVDIAGTALAAGYPAAIAARLGLAPDWVPLDGVPGPHSLPDLTDLTEGLESMLA